MDPGQKLQAKFESLRLVLEPHPDHWQAFVYDVENCEVLHTAQRSSIDGAKYAAVEYAAAHLFGVRNDLEPDTIAAMLVWETGR